MKVSILNSNSAPDKIGSLSGQTNFGKMVKNNKYGMASGSYSNVASDSVSFQGNLGTKILQSPTTHALFMKGKHNPLMIEAIFALLITCGLRPLTIMATAGKDEENKKKCKMQVAKSFSTGLVGLGTTFVVTKPLSDAIKKFAGSGSKNVTLPQELADQAENLVKPANEFLRSAADKLAGYSVKNMQGKTLETTIENIVATKGAKEALKEFSSEIFEKVEPAIKAQKGINKYRSTMCDLLNKVICPVFSPAKAAVTIALVPVILGLVFKKPKTEQKPNNEVKPQQQEQPVAKPTVAPINDTSNVFSNFANKGGQK